MRILVVDDERDLADSICDNLEFEDYTVDCAYGGRAALEHLLRNRYQLVILDVMMPDLDGFGVLEKMRKAGDQTPVIFLTARSTEADKLRGLGLGADDYVVKPFSILELVARVKAVLNRTAAGQELDALQVGAASICFRKLTIEHNGNEHEIGRYEADILKLLASDPGRVFSRNDILDNVWGVHAMPTNRTIDNYIVKLRQKLEITPRKPRHLLTIYGKGYKLANL